MEFFARAELAEDWIDEDGDGKLRADQESDRNCCNDVEDWSHIQLLSFRRDATVK